jgi:FkbM family methyltransferase
MKRLRALKEWQRHLGTLAGIQWYLTDTLNRHGLKSTATIRPKNLRYPVRMRMGESSDPDVFHQTFLCGGWAFLDDLRNIKTIIDLGGNIGLASALMCSRWLGCTVIAVEPDAGSFSLMCRNLEPYGVRCIEGAVWPTKGEVALKHSGDGREWARSVGEGSGVRAYDLTELIALLGSDVDLLKIDIEGTEALLFRGDTSWLGRVKNIAIELHGPDCERAFREGMRGFSWKESQCGEYTLCRDLSAL